MFGWTSGITFGCHYRIGLVPGWGFNEHERLADELSYISMPVVTYEQCIWSNPNFYGRFTSDKSFCAGFRNGNGIHFFFFLNIFY